MNSGFQRLVSLLDPGKEGKRKTASAELRKSMVGVQFDVEQDNTSFGRFFWLLGTKNSLQKLVALKSHTTIIKTRSAKVKTR